MGIFTILSIARTFFSGAFDFILRHWKPILVIAILAFLYFYRLHLLNKIEDLEVALATSQANLEQCLDNTAELQAGIERQNGEIQRWAEIGREQDQKLKALEGQLTERQKVIDARVHEILAGDKPESCDDAIQYLIESVPELKWQEQSK